MRPETGTLRETAEPVVNGFLQLTNQLQYQEHSGDQTSTGVPLKRMGYFPSAEPILFNGCLRPAPAHTEGAENIDDKLTKNNSIIGNQHRADSPGRAAPCSPRLMRHTSAADHSAPGEASLPRLPPAPPRPAGYSRALLGFSVSSYRATSTETQMASDSEKTVLRRS
ncbi:hypothetical protein DNTS_008419 [Danionella cerebrum]|uniref:Uncharacterized protein n=1 Tax=Danionella cerebrum TaxID=2873325 RepID=A0A553MTV5_9TELE|nr:hypothetical protein DNTS_008419 [Danionella translucida]